MQARHFLDLNADVIRKVYSFMPSTHDLLTLREVSPYLKNIVDNDNSELTILLKESIDLKPKVAANFINNPIGNFVVIIGGLVSLAGIDVAYKFMKGMIDGGSYAGVAALVMQVGYELGYFPVMEKINKFCKVNSPLEGVFKGLMLGSQLGAITYATGSIKPIKLGGLASITALKDKSPVLKGGVSIVSIVLTLGCNGLFSHNTNRNLIAKREVDKKIDKYIQNQF